LHAQTTNTGSLQSFIKNEGFAKITNKGKLPKDIMPYYRIVTDSLAHQLHNFDKYYMRLNTFNDYGAAIAFKIYLLKDIAFIKERHDADSLTKIMNVKSQSDTSKFITLADGRLIPIQKIDDYGGSDGSIIIVFSKADHSLKQVRVQ
jgi:hypothetical protein